MKNMQKVWITTSIDDYSRLILGTSLSKAPEPPLTLRSDNGPVFFSSPTQAYSKSAVGMGQKPPERGRVGQVARKGWRADPVWLRELAWLMAIYEDHCAYLPHHAEEESAPRLGLTPATVRKRFSTELTIESAEWADFELTRSEVEAATSTADLAVAYEPWKGRVPMVVFIEAADRFREDPELGPSVVALFDHINIRVAACEKCREWHTRKRGQ